MSEDQKKSKLAWIVLFGIKAVVLAAGVFLSTDEVLSRISVLLLQGKWDVLATYCFVSLCFLWILILVAYHPHWKWRAFWGGIFSLNAAIAFGYHRASGAGLTVFDLLTFWIARHEAGRAFDFYFSSMIAAGIFFLLFFAAFLCPVSFKKRGFWGQQWGHVLPFIPMMIIMGIVSQRPRGTQGMLGPFLPFPLAVVAGAKLLLHPMKPRAQVTWIPRGRKAEKIIFLVDESVRGDYLSFEPGNPFTPELPDLKPWISDFGHAASSGNCSHTSNAMLRFMVEPKAFQKTLLEGPFVWSYAQKAGYRTVYIDGQGAYVTGGGKMQNYMTLQEKALIDHFYAVDETLSPDAFDLQLVAWIKKELEAPGPVFIYANKNGAHFPYDKTYPEHARFWRPTLSEQAEGDHPILRVHSYQNAIRWSVGRDLKTLLEAMGSDAFLIYTSDHGQNLLPHHLTHCSQDRPDPREALVPLLTMTKNRELKDRYDIAAHLNAQKTSHFQIAPSLLDLFGYEKSDISSVYPKTLFDPLSDPPAFYTGDILSLFQESLIKNPIDLQKSYRESY